MYITTVNETSAEVENDSMLSIEVENEGKSIKP